LGANDYVTKPAQPEELLARVYSQLHLKQAIGDALAARMRLVRASRLQVVEQLAAAVAHEVNTPAQYVSDNLHYIRKVFASAAPPKSTPRTRCCVFVNSASARLFRRDRLEPAFEPNMGIIMPDVGISVNAGLYFKGRLHLPSPV
jgi:signal transduction histidine kinase